MTLVESADKPGKVLVKGEFARGNVATANKRFYKTKLWERELNRLSSDIVERKMLGELDHPSDGRTLLQRVSHIITDLHVDDNGVVVGEAEILDTQKGRDLQALLRSNAKIGVSSRGYGSTTPNDQGDEVVQEDYRLLSFDFVADPANRTSYPDVYYEEREQVVNKELNVQAKQPDPEATKKDKPAELAQKNVDQREAVKVETAKTPPVDTAAVLSVLTQLKQLIPSIVTPEDLQSALESKENEVTRLQAELADRDLVIKGLEEQLGELAEISKQIGYKYALERYIAGDENADMLRSVVGEVSMYESVEDIKQRVDATRKEIRRRFIREEKLARERERERQLIAEDRKTLGTKVERLEEALNKSSRLNRVLAVQVYAEQRLAKHPNAARIRKLIESSKPGTTEDVDAIIDSFQVPARDADELEAIRSRVRSMTKGGYGPSPLDDEEPTDQRGLVESNYNDLGVDLGTLKVLSGIPS
jgi:hypothetical protein